MRVTKKSYLGKIISVFLDNEIVYFSDIKKKYDNKLNEDRLYNILFNSPYFTHGGVHHEYYTFNYDNFKIKENKQSYTITAINKIEKNLPLPAAELPPPVAEEGPPVAEEGCKLDKKCPKEYSRSELVGIAKDCGLKINRKSPKKGKKNMKELCEEIKELIENNKENLLKEEGNIDIEEEEGNIDNLIEDIADMNIEEISPIEKNENILFLPVQLEDNTSEYFIEELQLTSDMKIKNIREAITQQKQKMYENNYDIYLILEQEKNIVNKLDENKSIGEYITQKDLDENMYILEIREIKQEEVGFKVDKSIEDFIEDKKILDIYLNSEKNWQKAIQNAKGIMKLNISREKGKAIQKYEAYVQLKKKEMIDNLEPPIKNKELEPEIVVSEDTGNPYYKWSEKLPNHSEFLTGLKSPHPNEFKTCKVFESCSGRKQIKDSNYNAHYKKDELIKLATACGVGIYKENGRKRTKAQLCNVLQKTYGKRKYPVFNPDSNANIDIESQQGFEGFEASCKNQEDVHGESTLDIPKDVLIKTYKGYCYNVNDIMRYLILNFDQNIDPINKSHKIWRDDIDKTMILSHPGILPDLMKEYEEMKEEVRKKIAEKTEIIRKTAEGEPYDLFSTIGITGFLLTSNKPSEHNDVDFRVGETALMKLRERYNEIPDKYVWNNLGIYDFKFKELLDNAHGSCLHGIGFKLSYIYSYYLNQIGKDTGVYGLFQKVPNTEYYISFHILVDDFSDLPKDLNDIDSLKKKYI